MGSVLVRSKVADPTAGRRGVVDSQIVDPALWRVVEAVLSVYIGEGRSTDGGDLYVLARTIAACGRTAIIRDGIVVPPPYPDLRERHIRQAMLTRHRLPPDDSQESAALDPCKTLV